MAYLVVHVLTCNTAGPIKSHQVVKGAENAGKFNFLAGHIHRTESVV